MGKYRKRPLEIEAVRVGSGEMPSWAKDAVSTGVISAHRHDHTALSVKTLEGEMVAREGNWIIRGIKGELYPCDAEIFQTTYEPVEG